MPTLQTIRAGIAELPKGPPLVVALMGGTSGIGSYVARAWADTFKDHGSKLRVYVVGRNASRGEEVINYGRKTSPGSDWRFLPASDTSLMSEVDRLCAEIIQQEEKAPFSGGPARLDVLYLSQALSPFQPSSPTKEGLDSQMSLIYYSRIRYIQNLIPLLTASPTTSTSHVISIFAGNMEDSLKTGEIPLGIPPPAIYGVTTVRKHTSFMKTFLFEELAEKHAGKISFSHIYPGLVDGPTFYIDANPWYFRLLWSIFKPLVSWYMTSPADCGAIMVFLATQRYPAKGTVAQGDEANVVGGIAYSSQREFGGGAYALGQRGDESNRVSWEKIRKEDTSRNVWDHTVKIIEDARKKSGV